MKRLMLFVALAVAAVLAPLAIVFSAPDIAWVKHPNNPVFPAGSKGAWDDKGVFAADVVLLGATYHMWYSARGSLDDRPTIGYATSPDGVTWTRYGKAAVLTYDKSPGSWERNGISAPSVLWDPIAYKWKMWYAGMEGFGEYKIGYAESPDGVHWTKYDDNPVLTLGDSTLDDVSLSAPSVLYRDGLYRMWYGAKGMHNQIFYATSADGVNWGKFSASPVVALGSDIDWDNSEITAPSVIWNGSQYEMWYQGYHTGTDSRYIGHAFSSDGVVWDKDGLNPVVGLEPGRWDSNSLYYPSVLTSLSGQRIMYYTGDPTAGGLQQIGLVLLDPNAQPTPLPTFPTETPYPGSTPTPVLTPVPVECGPEFSKECVFMPVIKYMR